MSLLKNKITFCLMYCGEETLNECLKSIEPFKKDIVWQEVCNVTPQTKALNQMLTQVNTEYLVPLDADMILNQNSFDRILNAIKLHENNKNWHSILFPLWDTFTDRKILALKVLRMDIIKNFLFKESRTPDIIHFHDLKNAGYVAITEDEPIGFHVVKGKYFSYMKYKDVYQTYRQHKWEWDSGVFFGGKTLQEKVRNHFDFFIYNSIIKKSDDYLWALAGMMDGLTSPLNGQSKDLSDSIKIDKSQAIDFYLKWIINFEKIF